MNRITASIALIAIVSAVLIVSGCGALRDQETNKNRPSNISSVERQSAVQEYNEGLKACRQERYAEAEAHFKKSLEFDPTQKTALLLIARAIHSQYRPRDKDPQNVDRARQAIEAYKRFLAADPQNDEADGAVGRLYGAIGDQHNQREWITRRANSVSLSSEKRSEAYTLLAALDWECSFEITEAKVNKQTKADAEGSEAKKNRQQEFDTARNCTMRGMEMVDKALMLNPENSYAWTYKSNLLRERAKLAEIEGEKELKALYIAQAQEAQQRSTEIDKKRLNQVQAKSGESQGRNANAQADGGADSDLSSICLPEAELVEPAAPSP